MISIRTIGEWIHTFRGWGKVFGLILGGLSGMGIFGAALGLLIGHFFDVMLLDRFHISKCIKFIGGESEVRLSEQWMILSSLAGIVAYALYPTQRPIGPLVRQALRDHFGLSSKHASSVSNLVYSLDAPDSVDIDYLLSALSPIPGRPDSGQCVELIFQSIPKGILTTKSSALRRIAAVSTMLGVDDHQFRMIRDRYISMDVTAYDIIGVSPDANWSEVRGTFRRLAASFHPDTGWALDDQQKVEIEEAFKRVTDAYERIRVERGKT